MRMRGVPGKMSESDFVMRITGAAGQVLATAEQRIVRTQLLAHRSNLLPFGLGRIGDVRVHGFRRRLEFGRVVIGVVDTEQLQRQMRITRMLRQRIKQVMLIFADHRPGVLVMLVGGSDGHQHGFGLAHETHQRKHADQ